MKGAAVISALAAALLLSACENPNAGPVFDGMRYTGRISLDKEDKRSFTATVAPVSQGVEAAREAARYEGTQHCVRNYGTSEIDWRLSPDADRAALQIAEDQMTVAGRCVE